MVRTIVIDTGTHAVGAYFVNDDHYVHFPAGRVAQELVPLVQEADELVTFSGRNRDLPDLARLAGLPHGADLKRRGKHTDMLSVCWDEHRMFGKSLRECYRMVIGELPIPDDGTYERNIELDVRMTFLLWKAWREGRFSHGPGNSAA